MTDTAADIMTKTIISVRPTDSVSKIAETLSTHGISAAPVLDDSGSLLGMVSEGDLMRSLGAKHATRRAWWLEMLAEGEDLSQDFLTYIRHDQRTAADLMTRNVITAAQDTPIADIADLLAQHHIKRVPVLDNGKVAGIVSRADIVRTLAGTKAK